MFNAVNRQTVIISNNVYVNNNLVNGLKRGRIPLGKRPKRFIRSEEGRGGFIESKDTRERRPLQSIYH